MTVDLELEVAVAAQAEAALAQERTQRWLRRITVVTALVLLGLSAATLAYVVSTATAARAASEGNRRLLAVFQADVEKRGLALADAKALNDSALLSALAEVERQRIIATEEERASRQMVLDTLVAELRDPQNTENRRPPKVPPTASPPPTVRSPRPTPRPAPPVAPMTPPPSVAPPPPPPPPPPTCRLKVSGRCVVPKR